MLVSVVFSESVIDGVDKEFFESLLPPGVLSFRQRKSYFEYYYTAGDKWEVDLEVLAKITNEYEVHIDFDTMTVQVN